jgi:hypothetical protein
VHEVLGRLHVDGVLEVLERAGPGHGQPLCPQQLPARRVPHRAVQMDVKLNLRKEE